MYTQHECVMHNLLFDKNCKYVRVNNVKCRIKSFQSIIQLHITPNGDRTKTDHCII